MIHIKRTTIPTNSLDLRHIEHSFPPPFKRKESLLKLNVKAINQAYNDQTHPKPEHLPKMYTFQREEKKEETQYS